MTTKDAVKALGQDAATPVRHAFFMLVKTTPAWLALAPPARFGFLGEVIAPLLARHPAVSMRFFDSEAFNARVTDVIVWETPDLSDYQELIEELRETLFWGAYFDIVEIVASIENAYATHYGVTPF